jgi:hypothetical protein
MQSFGKLSRCLLMSREGESRMYAFEVATNIESSDHVDVEGNSEKILISDILTDCERVCTF